MIHDKAIRVGACDWDHACWQEDFYPGDLPVDWRLSYYANAFSAVLVPEVRWRAEGVDFEQWAEDVPDGFRFYFLTSGLDIDSENITDALGALFAGFVEIEKHTDIAFICFADKSLREWKNWLSGKNYNAIFLMDENLNGGQLSDFQSLVELLGM